MYELIHFLTKPVFQPLLPVTVVFVANEVTVSSLNLTDNGNDYHHHRHRRWKPG